MRQMQFSNASAKMSADMRDKEPITFRGIGVNERLGAGRLKILKLDAEYGSDSFLGVTEETSRFLTARDSAARTFSHLAKKSERTHGPEGREILETYESLALDDDLTDAVLLHIHSGENAECAVKKSAEAIERRLSSIDDSYLAARCEDIKNVAREIVRELNGYGSFTADDKGDGGIIIVAPDLSPADSMRLELNHIAGFVLFKGSKNSHTSILASSLGISAIVSCETIPDSLDGEYALIDSGAGTVRVSPCNEEREEFEKRIAQSEEEERELEALRDVIPRTKDGRTVRICANIGSLIELSAKSIGHSAGCGLFRSEFIFLDRDSEPDEETQLEIYKKLLAHFGEKETVIRLLDIGADKIPPYFSALAHEENPALGIRGIRFLLREERILRTQLRAILRASVYGNAAIMLPMVTCKEEIVAVKKILSEEIATLANAGIPMREKLSLGIMIETPAAAIMSRELAPLSDFFSVGTNDLTQYTLAADRQNPALINLAEKNREPVMRLIEYAASAIHETGGWIGICGEAASDMSLTERFIQIGIDELSLASPMIPKLKKAVIAANR